LQDIELLPQHQDLGFQLLSRLEEAVAQHADEQEADCNHVAIMFRFADSQSIGQSFRKRQWLLKRVTANTPAATRARNRTRTAETVKNIIAKAVNTVFRWGVKKKHLARNSFEHAAALAVKAFHKRDDAARRWVGFVPIQGRALVRLHSDARRT
jgi:hypothetical protein